VSLRGATVVNNRKDVSCHIPKKITWKIHTDTIAAKALTHIS